MSPPFNLEFSPKIGVREAPELDGQHQSNLKGVYIIGDLADAPVIKMALRQGHEVADYVWQQDLGGKNHSDPEVLDILIVGAGPAGVAAGIALQQTQARFKLLEKDEPFATIAMFPASKLIFSEPQSLASPAGFWFEDASTEELLKRWGEILKEKDLPIQNHCSVDGLSKSGDHYEVRCEDGSVHKAARVLLATGRRGTPRSLNVPGEDSEKVLYNLRDPKLHAGEKVLVVGGGDSAVETACDVADAGGQVTLSYRSPDFSRPKAKNKKRIQAYAKDGKVKLELGTQVQAVSPETVTLKDGRELPNDRVFVQIGAKLPTPFLEKLGLRMSGSMNALRASWILGFGVLTWLFYLLKSGTEYSEQYGMHVAKKAFFPFGPDQVLGFVPDMLRIDLGFRVVDGAFWGTLTYSLLILVFGIRAYRKYASSIQKKRYLSLMGFQLLFLFGIPEIIAPAVIAIGGEGGTGVADLRRRPGLEVLRPLGALAPEHLGSDRRPKLDRDRRHRRGGDLAAALGLGLLHRHPTLRLETRRALLLLGLRLRRPGRDPGRPVAALGPPRRPLLHLGVGRPSHLRPGHSHDRPDLHRRLGPAVGGLVLHQGLRPALVPLDGGLLAGQHHRRGPLPLPGQPRLVPLLLPPARLHGAPGAQVQPHHHPGQRHLHLLWRVHPLLPDGHRRPELCPASDRDGQPKLRLHPVRYLRGGLPHGRALHRGARTRGHPGRGQLRSRPGRLQGGLKSGG